MNNQTPMIYPGLQLLLASLMVAPALLQASGDYTIDSSKSKLEIHVGREGLFKFLGHDHLIAAKSFSGSIHLDQGALERSSVRFRIEANSLVVLDPGVDEKERREVQTTMEGPKVLDVKQFPTIAFASTAITQTKRTNDGYELSVTGTLILHGVEKRISFPARVSFEGDQMRAQGAVEILQTDFKITPIRVGGGTVKVKDKLKITFDMLALR